MDTILARDLARRTAAVAFFALPVVYIAAILSTAVHEVLGHGLCAALLGGEFSGFVLKWDAMGWAYSDLPAAAPLSHHILYLASGILANILCGVMLLGLAFIVSKKPHVQLMLLIVSFASLIDGISYVLWNAYHPVPMGDIGRIIWLWDGPRPPDDSMIRWVLLVGGALLFAVAMFYLNSSVFVRLETLVLGGSQFKDGSRILALFLFLVLPGSVAWFSFDWDQLTPGIGQLPRVAGALSEVAVAILLFWYRPKWKHENSVHPIAYGQILVSWMCLTATILVLALWGTDGFFWR